MDAIVSRLATCCFIVALGFLGGGCVTTSVTPGNPANFQSMGMTKDEKEAKDKLAEATDSSINKALARQPLATFPCVVAVVRVQGPNHYGSPYTTFGEGDYCVVTTRNVETEADFKRLSAMPMCLGVAPVSHMMLPSKLEGNQPLRDAAAALHAQILIIYTIDTREDVEDHLTPLSFVTLGLSPNITVATTSTASAILIDTRNGYVYGYCEATEKDGQLANDWTISQATQDATRRSEARAFSKLTDALQTTWRDVLKTYANMGTGATQSSEPRK